MSLCRGHLYAVPSTLAPLSLHLPPPNNVGHRSTWEASRGEASSLLLTATPMGETLFLSLSFFYFQGHLWVQALYPLSKYGVIKSLTLR